MDEVPHSLPPQSEAEGHVLVVDDDRQIRQLAAKFLRGNGHRVTTARDGIEMRKAFESAAIKALLARKLKKMNDMRLMMKSSLKQIVIGAVFAAALTSIGSAWAAAQDYQFQLVGADLKTGKPGEITVRLVYKAGNHPVPGAVIFASKIDMVGMEDMTSPLEKVQGGEPGTYKFKTTVSMEGDWTLHLAAKVQGEAETVKGELTVKAKP